MTALDATHWDGRTLDAFLDTITKPLAADGTYAIATVRVHGHELLIARTTWFASAAVPQYSNYAAFNLPECGEDDWLDAGSAQALLDAIAEELDVPARSADERCLADAILRGLQPPLWDATND